MDALCFGVTAIFRSFAGAHSCMTWKYDVFSEFCRCMFVHDLDVRCVFGVLQMHVLCMTWMYDGISEFVQTRLCA